MKYFIVFLIFSVAFLLHGSAQKANALSCATYSYDNLSWFDCKNDSDCDAQNNPGAACQGNGKCSLWQTSGNETCSDDSSDCSGSYACQNFNITYSCKAKTDGGGCTSSYGRTTNDDCNSTLLCASGECSGGSCVALPNCDQGSCNSTCSGAGTNTCGSSNGTCSYLYSSRGDGRSCASWTGTHSCGYDNCSSGTPLCISNACVANPTLTVTSTDMHTGDNLSFSFTKFGANTSVSVIVVETGGGAGFGADAYGNGSGTFSAIGEAAGTWTLKATDSTGRTATTTFAVVALNKPTLSSPANNATGVSTTPTLSWNSVTGAQCYTVFIPAKGSWATTVTSLMVPSASALSNSTSYTWDVIAYSGALVNSACTGTASPVSDQWSFTTVAATPTGGKWSQPFDTGCRIGSTADPCSFGVFKPDSGSNHCAYPAANFCNLTSGPGCTNLNGYDCQGTDPFWSSYQQCYNIGSDGNFHPRNADGSLAPVALAACSDGGYPGFQFYTPGTTTTQQCAPPTGFSCSVIGDDIKGSWTKSVDPANYIFRACVGTSCTSSEQVSGNENFISGLQKGTAYTLSARVENGTNTCTAPSNWSSPETTCTIPVAATPTYILSGKVFIDTDYDGLIDTGELTYPSSISLQLSSTNGGIINGIDSDDTITTSDWARTAAAASSTAASYNLTLTIPSTHQLTKATIIQKSTGTVQQTSDSNSINLTSLSEDKEINFGLTPLSASTVMMQGHFVDADGSYISNVVTGTAVTITGGGLAADQTNYATNSSADPSFWKTASPPTSTSPTLPASTTAYTVTAPAITGYTLTSYSVWARDDSTNSKSGITHTNYTSGNAASVTLQYDGNYADIFFKYTKDVTTAYTCVDNGGVCSATACQLPQTSMTGTCPSSGNCCTKYVAPPPAPVGTNSIEGYVWDDATQDVPVGKDKGTGESCYAGTSTIDLYLNAGQTPFKTASTTGCTKYSFTGLAAGTYTIKIRTLPSGYTQTPNQTLSVTIPN